MLTHGYLEKILLDLDEHGSSVAELLLEVLSGSADEYQDQISSIAVKFTLIMNAAQKNAQCAHIVTEWTEKALTKVYANEILTLTKKESGFHFVAKETTEESLRSITIDHLAKTIEAKAPNLWRLLNVLSSADPKTNYQRAWLFKRRAASHPSKGRSKHVDGDLEMEDFGEDGFERDEEDPAMLPIGLDEDEPEDLADQIEERRLMLEKIVSHLSIISKSQQSQYCRKKQSASAS